MKSALSSYYYLMGKKSIDIFDYHDYREYLRAWFYSAREERRLSLRDIAETCGLATGYLPMVLSEKRNLSEKALTKLQSVLNLSIEGLSYFKALLDLSDSELSETRLKAFDELKKLRTFRKKSVKELEVHEYLSDWLNVTIRELSFRKDFIPDAQWIHNRLVVRVSLKDIDRSLKFLLDHGFIVINGKGKTKPTEKQLDCFGGVYKISLGQFHKQMFALASQSIDLTARDERNLLGHTFLISEDRISALSSILDEALKKVEELSAGADEIGPVYHVTLATFPLAKKG